MDVEARHGAERHPLLALGLNRADGALAGGRVARQQLHASVAGRERGHRVGGVRVDDVDLVHDLRKREVVPALAVLGLRAAAREQERHGALLAADDVQQAEARRRGAHLLVHVQGGRVLRVVVVRAGSGRRLEDQALQRLVLIRILERRAHELEDLVLLERRVGLLGVSERVRLVGTVAVLGRARGGEVGDGLLERLVRKEGAEVGGLRLAVAPVVAHLRLAHAVHGLAGTILREVVRLVVADGDEDPEEHPRVREAAGLV